MKTRRSIRRILAVLLLIVMAFSILSESALAAPGGGGGTWGRYYYFRNETDASMGDNIKVYYSINGGSLQQIENGGSVSIPEREAYDGSTAIVFYIYITDEAENSGVTFTTDNQAKTLRSITEERGQAVIEGGNTVGDHDFSTVTNEAYDRYGCRYALYYSSFDYDQYGGNNYRGFQVWMNLPSQEERSWIVYHSNISSTEDTTRYQTIDSNTSSVTLWQAVYENEGYTLAGWNTEADGTGTSYELGATVSKDALTFDGERTEHLYAVWEQNAVSSHSVTAVFVDENGTALQESQTETFSAGAEYAYTIGGGLPLTIEKDGVQYVYDHLGEESDALSGPVNGDKTINLVYSVDANGNQVPDEYDATVTYRIVNGTWSDGSTADIACLFGCASLNGSEWVYTPQTLGETIPEGMRPDDSHIGEGAWNETISDTTPVTGDAVYTYTFSTAIPAYSLIYDANGGDEDSVPTDENTNMSGTVVQLDTEKTPTHTDVDGEAVVFLGWSTEPISEIVSAGEAYNDALNRSVTFAESDCRVYAVWGYDTNDDGIADASQVMIEPAAITIYTGGSGYEGTVSSSDGTLLSDSSSGLPEPGFYFTLPYEMNEAIKNASGGDVTDLSQYLSISAKAHAETGTSIDRNWTITLYDVDGNSAVDGRYLYRFEGAEGQDPVRMQFTDAEGRIVTSDAFDVSTALSQTYTMSLYTGAVDAGSVTAEVTGTGEETLTASIGLVDSTLTICGVSGEETTTPVQMTLTGEETTLGRVPDADHLLSAEEMKTWPDNPEDAWYYADIQEATNSHDYEWITEDGETVEQWTGLL